jgi:hypothetical protein
MGKVILLLWVLNGGSEEHSFSCDVNGCDNALRRCQEFLAVAQKQGSVYVQASQCVPVGASWSASK